MNILSFFLTMFVSSSSLAVGTPTLEPAFNQEDKIFLCQRVQLSKTQCEDTEIMIGGTLIFGRNGVSEYVIDILMKNDESYCPVTVTKIFQPHDQTWIHSSIHVSNYREGRTCTILKKEN